MLPEQKAIKVTQALKAQLDKLVRQDLKVQSDKQVRLVLPEQKEIKVIQAQLDLRVQQV